MRALAVRGPSVRRGGRRVLDDMGVLAGVTLLALGALTLRRRTA